MKKNEMKDNIVRYFLYLISSFEILRLVDCLSNSLEFLVLQIMGFQG